MCKAAFLLQDQESVNAYLNLIRTWIKDTISLVALSLTSGRVIGVAVTRISNDSDKTDTYNRVQVCVLSYKNKCFKP
jgi:dTDP-4-dehydrorhamnose 3,5-epimerase-like enzyme